MCKNKFTIIPILTLGCTLISQSVIATSLPSSIQEVMTLDEAAKFLRISPMKLEKLAQEKTIPARRIDAKWRFSRTSLLQWFNNVNSQNSNKSEKLSKLKKPVKNKAIDSNKSTGNVSSKSGQKIVNSQINNSSAKPLPKTDISQLISQNKAVNSSNKPVDNRTHLGENSAQKTAEDVFLRDQGVLLKHNQATVEVDLLYSKSEQSGLFSGSTALDTFVSNYGVRYGLWDDLQLSASLPLYHQINTTVYDQQSSEKTTNTRWGNASFALRQVAIKENVGYPTVIVSLEGRVPTNKGNYATGGTISLTKSIDPAVLFGNFGYLHTFTGVPIDDNTLQVENTFSSTFGIAYALNDTLMLSTSASGVTTKFTQHSSVPQERYSLQFGLTSLITERLYIEPTISFGLNNPNSKDMSFGVNVPYTF
jgi:excisionase family DNA binding protein